MFKRNYEIKVECLNCGKNSKIKIPRGVRIKDYLSGYSTAQCYYCGCGDVEPLGIEDEPRLRRKPIKEIKTWPVVKKKKIKRVKKHNEDDAEEDTDDW